ncbi:MAG TPA: PASTA domain-containing protein, partial [Acidimicrobiales bacterium]|nr:PASTA domain-containing protein [Acidimicrobiales bacterium]
GDTGLVVGSTSQACSNTYGSGLVASQTPSAGRSVAPKSPVNLVFSSGPCQSVLPGVTGLTATAAKATLAGKGFSKVSVVTTASCDPSQNGKVVSQTPTAGSSAATSATVRLTVCNNTTPTTTTTTAPTTTTTTLPVTPTT